jgi:phosphoenolpyruvate---glycerone phosphotransferase subunit DhaL
VNTTFILTAIDAVNAAIIAHEADIEGLDRDIGDGDHYINIKRGCAAAAAMRPELEGQPLDVALQKIGMKMLSSIGGASGPLIASFFLDMAKASKLNPPVSLADHAALFAAGVAGIQHRGKAQVGEKTMMDVLIPVAALVTELAGTRTALDVEMLQAIKAEAEKCMLATRDMLATKGRAAGLGERAIGHIDPGAKSCQVMINAVCDLLLSERH